MARMGAPASRAWLPELAQELSFTSEFQKVRVVLAVVGDPHVVLVIDEEAVLNLRPVESLARAAPRVNQFSSLIEFEDRWSRNAAFRLGWCVAGAGESLVAAQRARTLRDINMVLSIDRHAADRTDRPVFRKRLRKRRVVFENRDLHALREIHARGRRREDGGGREDAGRQGSLHRLLLEPQGTRERLRRWSQCRQCLRGPFA